MDIDDTLPPSSPPLGAIADTVATKVPTKPSSPKSPKLPPRRKRPRVSDGTTDQGYASASSSHNGDVSCNSSDAPFFSSDDLAEADAANYDSPARKKQYRRAWYEPERAESAVTHRMMRNSTRLPKDSGIYMGSDSSNSSFSEGFELETAALKTKAVQHQSKTMQAFLAANESEQTIAVSRPSSQVKLPQTPSRTREETVVEHAVNNSLENSAEEVDLSGCNLTTLPSGCFAPLHNFIKQPIFYPNAYTDAACAPLTPKLKIFLMNNRLASVPASLFDLSRLTVLSLRGNNLTELPSAIGRLRNLKELNLDGNPLRYLPYEVLHLFPINGGCLEWLYLPMSMLALGLPPTRDLARLPQYSSSDRFKFIGRTSPALYDLDGTVFQNSSIPPSQYSAANTTNYRAEYDDLEISASKLAAHTPVGAQRVPSLFELALRICARSPLLPELAFMLPQEAPKTVFSALDRAQKITQCEGIEGSICSVCGRPYIITRAEWIEVICNLGNGSGVNATCEPIPLLRQACSWGCVKSLKGASVKENEL